jgi:hypothetical protein
VQHNAHNPNTTISSRHTGALRFGFWYYYYFFAAYSEPLGVAYAIT